MERHTVGVQTRFDERDSEVTLDVIRRRLCRLSKWAPFINDVVLVTGCDTGSDEMNIEVQLSFKSLVLPTEVCNMLPVNSRQTSYLPKHPVTNIDVKDATTYAVAMWHNSSNAISNSIGEVYVVDIESRIPAVSMRCLGGISKLAFGTDESSLLFGGSLCGAIHVWDTSIHLEVANIPPSISNGHIDPIVYMKLLDSDNLLSVDATGRAMTWSLRNLSEPVSRIEWEIPDYSCRISAVCHGTSFYCTSLSGRIYICNLGEIPSEPQVIHDAGITSSASSTIGPIELIATSSLDCTVKIWDCQVEQYMREDMFHRI
ncbi:cytoplasmic dynein intermediate chain 1, putative [Babesia ovis]|uniref:Cytoplasmic dynein intermediate chain 1, putative n=1 Tax=Babesia ovis TaxID=5869 RepID=A0A9W5WU26_BABOV|nr:cytoplasmic dynein intermediate chain 1, putative [Babesia ovis]